MNTEFYILGGITILIYPAFKLIEWLKNKVGRRNTPSAQEDEDKGPIHMYSFTLRKGTNVRYLCNIAVKPRENARFTAIPFKVTCKNCKRIIERERKEFVDRGMKIEKVQR